MKLYELVKVSNDIVDKVIQGGGELTPELEQALEQVQADLTVKTDSYAHVLDKLENEAKYWSDKAKELDQVAKAFKRSKEKLEDYLKSAMIQMNVKELAGDDVKFKLTSLFSKVEIEDLSKIPAAFQKMTVDIDKRKLQKALKEGPVPGAKLGETISLRKYVNKGAKNENE